MPRENKELWSGGKIWSQLSGEGSRHTGSWKDSLENTLDGSRNY